MFTIDSFKLFKEISKYVKNNKKDSNYLLKLFNLLEEHSFTYNEPTNLYKTGKYPYINNFIPEEYNIILKKYKNKQIIKWKIKSEYEVDCTLCIYTKNKNLKEETVNLLVYALSFILSFSNHNLKFKCHLVLLPFKKKFNNKFTPKEINSGMSSTSNGYSEIYVWRLEECIKVIIHECIHSLRFSHLNDTNDLINHYNNKYNSNSSKMTINETYTEIWARLLNCYFLTKIKEFENNYYDSYTYFCFLLEMEKQFGLIQSSKVQKYLLKNPNYDINKHTNVIAYHIGVFELLDNLEEFLKFRFKEKNVFYLEDDNKFINLLLKNKDIKNIKLDDTKFYNKTFRMIINELKIL